VHAGRQKLKLDEETRWQVAGEARAGPLRRLEGVLYEEAPISHPNEANDKREC